MRAPVEVEWFTATSACVGGSLLMLFSRFSGKMLTNGIPVYVRSKVKCRSIVNFPDDSWRLSKIFSFMAAQHTLKRSLCLVSRRYRFYFFAQLLSTFNCGDKCGKSPTDKKLVITFHEVYSGIVSLARKSTFKHRRRPAENKFSCEKLGKF